MKNEKPARPGTNGRQHGGLGATVPSVAEHGKHTQVHPNTRNAQLMCVCFKVKNSSDISVQAFRFSTKFVRDKRPLSCSMVLLTFVCSMF